MTKGRKRVIGACVLLGLLGVLFGIRILWGRAWQRITVAPETTRVLAPLRADGTVDYVAALNAHYAKGITPENNAAVPLLGILAHGPHHAEYLRAAAVELGIPELANTTPGSIRFESLYDCRKARLGHEPDNELSAKWYDDAGILGSTPWKTMDHEEVARWLREQQPALDEARKAVERPRFYLPLVRPHEFSTVFTTPVGLVGECRSLAEGLCIRAMLRESEGDPEGACQDILAAIRLGRLTGQRPSLIGRMVGLSMVGKGLDGCGSMLEHGLPGAQAQTLVRELASPDLIPDFAEVLDIGERYELLDLFTHMSRFGPDSVGETYYDGIYSPPQRAGDFAFGIVPVNFDALLKQANKSADRLVAAARLPDWRKRDARLRELDGEFDRAATGLPFGRQEVLRRLGLHWVTNKQGVLRHRDYGLQQLSLVTAGLQARIHFAVNGRPLSAAEIAAFLNTVSPDLFSEKPFEFSLGGRVIEIRTTPAPPIKGHEIPRVFTVRVKVP